MKLEVYKITNKQNGKIYIGITNQGVATRWCKHCSDARGSSLFSLHNAIRKYGEENFQIETIEIVDDVEVLKKREIYWIKDLNSYNRKKGYNLTLGGDGTFGRFHSEETKDKIRQKAIGRKASKEAKDKMSISQKKIYRNYSQLGKNGNTKRWSNLNNIKEASENNYNNKCILKCSKEGIILEEFRSISEAARIIGKSRQSLSKVVTGKAKTAYGFIWKYKKINF